MCVRVNSMRRLTESPRSGQLLLVILRAKVFTNLMLYNPSAEYFERAIIFSFCLSVGYHCWSWIPRESLCLELFLDLIAPCNTAIPV